MPFLGGLLARGIIEKLGKHNIDTFISISAPQNGQYGETEFVRKIYPNLPKNSKKYLHNFFYSNTGQKERLDTKYGNPLKNNDFGALIWEYGLSE